VTVRAITRTDSQRFLRQAPDLTLAYRREQPHTRCMTTSRSRSVDRQSEIVDVQLLDVLAQIEALLRNGREVQRESLRLRGVPNAGGRGNRRDAAERLRKLVAAMLADSRSLSQVLRDLNAAAKSLHRLSTSDVRAEQR
jgi:hypothetical protein